jgi:flagellar hook-associated protein 3 FlgL
MTNVSTQSTLLTLQVNMAQLQGNLSKVQEQISSGKLTTTLDGLSNPEQFGTLNTQVIRLTNYQQGNNVTISQMQTANTALTQIIQVATQLNSLVASQISNTAGVTGTAAFNQQVQASLSSITGALNTTFAGQYVFGGDKTNTAPVLSPLPNPVQVGVADTTYYAGGTQSPPVQVSDTQQIVKNARADNPAFQQIIAGITQALQANGDTTKLQAAENLVNSGLQGVIALQANVNANVVTVQSVNTQSQSLQIYFSSLTADMTNADPVALSTQAAQDQTTFEAAYQVYARMSSFFLGNYLK